MSERSPALQGGFIILDRPSFCFFFHLATWGLFPRDRGREQGGTIHIQQQKGLIPFSKLHYSERKHISSCYIFILSRRTLNSPFPSCPCSASPFSFAFLITSPLASFSSPLNPREPPGTFHSRLELQPSQRKQILPASTPRWSNSLFS